MQRAERLPERVVQLVREAAALGLLRVDQLVQQLLPDTLGSSCGWTTWPVGRCPCSKAWRR